MKKLYFILMLTGLMYIIVQSSFKNPQPQSKAELGKLLFFDPILSANRTVSCASCHKEEFAFSDSSTVSVGVYGRKGVRNTPSAMNLTLQERFFWDGRAATLEEQALGPITNPIEMNLPIAIAVKRLKGDAFYRRAFQNLFHEAPSQANLAAAIATFERTLETNDSPFDDWRLNDNEDAVSASAKRGFALFTGKGNCVQCHFGPDFNSTEFRNIGLYDGKTLTDSGRAAITKNKADIGKFKIGPLRNIALTAPYMHNGKFTTLRQVIDYYDDPDKVVPHSIGRDSLLNKPLNLTEKDKQDLENFLVSLTDKRFKH